MSDAPRFVVSRVEWVEAAYGGDGYLRRTPRAERVANFRTFEAAEFERRRREEEARRGANPFRYGGEALFYQTSLDAPRLHDWLMDAGIEPPASPSGHAAWVAWWDASARDWTAEQRAHAWAALDKVRFYEVTEELPSRKAYVIIEVNWLWEDEPTLEADYEGGNVVRAFRSRASAEAECERLNDERRRQSEHRGYRHFTRRTRGDGSDDASRGMTDTVFFEVVAIELGEDA